jgi:dihydropteroate synthase
MHSDLHVTPRSWAGLRLDRPLVMGILNLTSDSFSGAGPADPIAAGRALRDAGADIVDIGAESTRPGAGPVPAAEQIARVTAVIAALCRDRHAQCRRDGSGPAGGRDHHQRRLRPDA